jgi:hypothetical protein
MADGTPKPPTSDSLSGPDRMLNAINNLQTGGHNRGALRTMFGAINTEAKAVEVTQAKLKQGLQRTKPKLPQPGPSL